MPRPKLSRNKIKTAIVDSGGIIAIVCKRTGYSWSAVRNFIRADSELSQMMSDEADTINDVAEATIISKIKSGDDGSAKWWLARTRRAKFGDNVDLTTDGKKVEFVIGVKEIIVDIPAAASDADDEG